MSRKLYYFDLKGLGEGLRYLLHYGGLEFEDIRVPRDDYQKHKDDISPPFGKLPVYKEGNVTLHQSIVIAKYIGRQLNLVPSDPLEEAQVESVIHTVYDFISILKKYRFEADPEKKEILKKQIVEETFGYYFSRFEKQLLENNGHFGKKISWVDIIFVGLVDTICDHLDPNLLKKYTKTSGLINEIHNISGIKLYRSTIK